VDVVHDTHGTEFAGFVLDFADLPSPRMVTRYMYPVVNVFLFFLSSHWMMQITAGMMKQLRKASVKKAANGDAHAHGEKNNGITDTDATKDTCAVDGDSNANARKKKEQ